MPLPAWDDNRPLGSAQLSLGDDELRTLRSEIHQRMDHIVEDWTADPVVLKINAALRTGLKLMLSPFELFTESLGSITVVNPQFLQVVGDAYIPLPVQKGWKITKIEMVFDPNGQSITHKVIRTSFDTSPTDTQLSTGSTSGGPLIVVVSLFTGNEVVTDAVYRVELDGPGAGSWKYYGARVTYDEV